ncbi:MAG: hypothetical protein AAF598_07055 [Bacteroidota bacterium]
MNPTFYTVNTKLPYSRSPIKIQALTSYDTLAPLDEHSILIKNNRFKVDFGKKWFDLLQFADSFQFAISKRMKHLLEEKECTGWSCFPIQIENHPDKEYYAFYVTAKVGKIQNLEALNNYETDQHEFDLNT